ncbi:MAG: decaprenyl-phosphate phosphoribosyltransferase [Propionibacteriaceae bacterium]|nr:decaprenyl-phosphate phosphoribosyltransferase [Propionibacteriaceae bacterium]
MPAWIRALRPKQWLKNVLVLAAPFAAGTLTQQDVWLKLAGAFAAFSLVASSIYLINDTKDAEADRAHPTKRFRPIAARELSPVAAIIMAVVCLAGGLTLAWFISTGLFATVASYWVLQLAYALWLKYLPIFDLAIVATGFLLRAIAGGAALEIPLSQWFLLVAAFGSLFMVAGKRYGELKGVGSEAGTRSTLKSYTESYLRVVWATALALVIMCYSLWAFEAKHIGLLGLDWRMISLAPFTLALLRYAMVIDAGDAEEPESVALGDRMLQAFAVLWVAALILAVFG